MSSYIPKLFLHGAKVVGTSSRWAETGCGKAAMVCLYMIFAVLVAAAIVLVIK